jgi:hypothetical protein
VNAANLTTISIDKSAEAALAEPKKKRGCFSQWYFPAKEKKPPKPKSVSFVNDKGEKEELSLREYKNALRQFFTVRRSTVVECKHKIDLDSPPKNNCQVCWFAWFNQHGELVTALDEAFNESPEILDRIWGTKVRKNFTRFMSTLAAWKAEQEKDVKGTTGADGIGVETGRSDHSFNASPVAETA